MGGSRQRTGLGPRPACVRYSDARPRAYPHRASAALEALIRSVLDALVWSSAWVAAAAAAMTGASSLALGHEPAPAVLLLAVAGTLVVYTIDRLRDVERDRDTSPERATFVERHRHWLVTQTAVAAILAAAAGWAAGWRVVALAAGVAALGLFHRRLKRFAWAKPAYLTGAWTAVCAGFPAAHAGTWEGLLPVAVAIGATVQANVALSNLRDDEALAARLGQRRVLGIASGFLLMALAAAWLGGPSTRPLAALPLLGLGPVLFFRPSERYGAVIVDGALVVGGAIAWGLLVL